jgi:hypothetical protein
MTEQQLHCRIERLWNSTVSAYPEADADTIARCVAAVVKVSRFYVLAVMS